MAANNDTIDIVPCLGGRITFWRSVTQEPFIMQTFAGYRIDFVKRPPMQQCLPQVPPIFLDDILVLVNSRQPVCQHSGLCFENTVGRRIQTNPSQVFPYLGLEWNTLRLEVILPKSRWDQIRNMIVVMENTPVNRTRVCIVLLRKKIFASMAIPLGQLQARLFESCLPNRQTIGQ